jgi:hypothetical protein
MCAVLSCSQTVVPCCLCNGVLTSMTDDLHVNGSWPLDVWTTWELCSDDEIVVCSGQFVCNVPGCIRLAPCSRKQSVPLVLIGIIDKVVLWCAIRVYTPSVSRVTSIIVWIDKSIGHRSSPNIPFDWAWVSTIHVVCPWAGAAYSQLILSIISIGIVCICWIRSNIEVVDTMQIGRRCKEISNITNHCSLGCKTWNTIVTTSIARTHINLSQRATWS